MSPPSRQAPQEFSVGVRGDPFRHLKLDPPFPFISPRLTAMPIEMYREGGTFRIQVDLPGIEPDSIDLTITQDTLTIRTERPEPPHETVDLIMVDRPAGTFIRSVSLAVLTDRLSPGETLDLNNVSAEYSSGVLTVAIPVREATQPHEVGTTGQATDHVSTAPPSEPSDSMFDDQVQAARRNRELITRLAQWRAEYGPSQAEVAKRMHTSQPAVARLESHQHDAQLSTLARYVAALDLSLHFVLTDPRTLAPIWTSIEEQLERRKT
jgi:HSP20 family protein